MNGGVEQVVELIQLGQDDDAGAAVGGTYSAVLLVPVYCIRLCRQRSGGWGLPVVFAKPDNRSRPFNAQVPVVVNGRSF